ncbi:polysaccharide pyruvyl transferase CsaB [bacterium]|nr:polysaccharide pyruvyl transferase CsaB [bacterium]
MAKKAVLSGYFGFDNFGDDAILAVLTEKLKTLDTDITIFSANPEKTEKDYRVKAVRSFDVKNVIKTIKNSDILISGGGSLLQDVTSLKSLVYYAGIIFLALLFKKKVLIFAQGIGPLNRKISRFLVINLLKKVSYISVRDEKSLKFLEDYKIIADLVNDPVYSVQISDVPKNFAVGVQLRDFKTMNIEFLDSLAESLLLNFPSRKFELFVFQKAYDAEVCFQFEKILKAKNPDVDTEIIFYDNRNEIFRRISQLDYMVAMRFHAIIASLKAGIRVAGINYDVKVEKLAKEASIPLISLNAVDNNYDAVFERQKSLNPARLSDFANSKSYDWTEFEAFFLS